MKDISPHDIAELEKMLADAGSPIIVTHTKPDGDAMGSCTAMYHFLRASGKKCRIVLSDPFPANLDFLTDGEDLTIFTEDAETARDAIMSADLLICLDFNAFRRTEHLEESLTASTAAKILIDHHLNPDAESFSLVFSETEASSASELLYHILMKTSGISGDASRLPAKAAEALMTGMTTDTNNFANSVFPSTLQMASALLAAGVDRDRIITNIYNRHSESRLRLLGHALKDLMTITEDGVAYIVLDSRTLKEYDIQEGDTEGFVNMLLSIAKVRMSLLLKEDGDRIRVSIRSRKGTSANRCARLHFNGGGHENAAGGRLQIPEDISGIEAAGEYIEKHTHIYLNSEEA